MRILIAILMAVALYCVLAIFLKIPSLKMSVNISKRKSTKTLNERVENFITSLASIFEKYVPMSRLQQIKLENMLASADINETPKLYIARNYVIFILFLVVFIPIYFISPLFIFLSVIFGFIAVKVIKNKTIKKGNIRKAAIEKELPHFTSNFANSIKTNRNIIDIFEIYKQNSNSELSRELSITLADMRTGSQERALQKLETRVNSPLMSELVRGILSTIRGENMTLYFDNLVFKMSSMWEQRLKEHALKIKPKLSTISIIVAMYSIAMLLYVIISAFVNSAGSIV